MAAGVQDKNIPRGEKFSLAMILGKPVVIQKWNLQKLPKDSFSVDNAIIITKSLRWPLIIDPQVRCVSLAHWPYVCVFVIPKRHPVGW